MLGLKSILLLVKGVPGDVHMYQLIHTSAPVIIILSDDFSYVWRYTIT